MIGKGIVMRNWARTAVILMVTGFGIIPLAQSQEPSAEWVDPTTGHRIVRLSQEPGSSSAYFTQNEFTPDGRTLIITTPGGISAIDFQTRAIRPVVDGKVRMIEVGRKTGQVYYMKENAVYAADVQTRTEREIAKLPFRGGVASVNADETLLAGSYVEGESSPSQSPPAPAAPPPGQRAAAIESSLYHRWSLHLPMGLFTVDVRSGEVKTIYRSRDWLNHVQFSPADPGLLLFCHEGPWHLLDRIWMIHADGTGLTKIHTRTLQMEIAGHEFWGADGKTIWYDLQTPRGEDFWVAGFQVATGERVWYHLERNQWSVHFNVSPDATLFAGDGGDAQMVARASDGKWIYLFHPEIVPNRGVEQAGLIEAGVFRAERLVNMAKHNYHLEPNVQFTPDGKWIVFRSNMNGPTQVYAVEVAKSP